jgi:hypothetical protein
VFNNIDNMLAKEPFGTIRKQQLHPIPAKTINGLQAS